MTYSVSYYEKIQFSQLQITFMFQKADSFNMRFEILAAVQISMLILWVVTPFGLVSRYQCFEATYYLHLQG
jgi:hypothetical protein